MGAPYRRRRGCLYQGRSVTTGTVAPLSTRRAAARSAARIRAASCEADARRAERKLLVQYHRDGDLAAREALVERFLPLARHFARRYAYMDEPFDDLFQVASLGLILAIDRFEPNRGTRFTSYAAPTINGELKRHFRDNGWSLHVPRDLQERALAVTRATDRLCTRLGRSPTARDVAAELTCSVEEVLEAREAAASYEAMSLDAATGPDNDDGALSPIDGLRSDDPSYELVESRDAIATTWKALPELERRVLELRFTHHLTQSEIGRRTGRSQMQVSRLMRRGLQRLETAAEA
jgi:RNA polymerase sigma-B factor